MFIVLENVCSFLCSIITFQILTLLFDMKKNRIRQIVLFIACFLLNGMIIYMGDIANMPPTFLIFLLGMQWACNGSIQKKLTIGFILSTVPFAINCLMDSFLFYHDEALSSLLVVSACKICFWLLLWLLISRFKIPKDFDLPSKYWNVLLLISCTPFLILLAIVVLPNEIESLSQAMSNTLIVILFIIILSVIGLLYAIFALYKASELEQEKLLWEVNNQYYQNLETQMYQIRKFRHDLANHLQVLSIMPENEMKSYVSQLMQEQSIAKPMVFCRDSVMNALISSKYDYIVKNEIVFQYEINLKEDHLLAPTDVCGLIGNLLDNAIEGCLKLENNRFIRCDISCEKGLLVIQIANSCLEQIDASLSTQKEDTYAHGFGVKSIKEIVKRNKGTIQMTHEKGTFEVFIVFPV